MNGYTGKILRLDLSNNKITTIATEKYQDWGGGHGIGSAIFWDLVKDKAISGFDPANVITIMTSPLTGTLAPSASRTEMQGIGVQSSPIEWFTRSNFGGGFGTILKCAGWDGIVIEGRSDKPVWIDIRDSKVTLQSARDLWGKDTWSTQEIIWEKVKGSKDLNDWADLGDNHRTTQKPAVLAIGQSGENLSRVAAVIHGAGSAAGQGGFGGVWGSKYLKAISVIGTGSIKISDPKAMIDARLWAKKYFTFDHTDSEKVDEASFSDLPYYFGAPFQPTVGFQRGQKSRLKGCLGCHCGCRLRTESGGGNESTCIASAYYTPYDQKRNSNIAVGSVASLLQSSGQEGATKLFLLLCGKESSASYSSIDLVQRYGINAYEMYRGIPYLRGLYEMGVLGPGKEIECDLPFEEIGSAEFIEELLHMVAFRQGIGDDIAEGFFRAADRWGRLEQDLAAGLLPYPYWGLPEHGYDPRADVDWGYGSILGDRDINEHCFNFGLHWMPSLAKWTFKDPPVTAKEIVEIVSQKLSPFQGDPEMLDFSTENIYSDHIVKLVAWHRYYTRFWKQSALFCDNRFPDFYNPNRPDNTGLTGEGEPMFFNAVTGKNITFEDGLKIGKRIWNLDNAIWALQGRHRDMVRFSEYIYTAPFAGKTSVTGAGSMTSFYLTGKEDGNWEYIPLEGRHLDEAKFENWKTRYYEFEGWDQATGWPKGETLESLGLENVARALETVGKLGKG
jgi:aldehyde:ferredoxin oxidoreductase